LAIAFAIASGVSPEKWIFTAIIAGLVISALGGSRVQIGGPTGAFIVIVYGIVQQFGINGLIIATFMAGVLLVIMGLTKLGSAIKYIPYPFNYWLYQRDRAHYLLIRSQGFLRVKNGYCTGRLYQQMAGIWPAPAFSQSLCGRHRGIHFTGRFPMAQNNP
jgi:hypothetical protein